MSIISVLADPAYTLDQLTDWVRTQEATYGEIGRIGNDGTKTAGSFYRFDPAHPRPTIEADLNAIADGAAAVTGELCRGIVFIGNSLTHVAVIRPAA
jgi:hypothetical protein